MKKLEAANTGEMIVLACRILDNEGIVDELGHFSARGEDEDTYLMNGKVSPGMARPEDIITMSLDGVKLDGKLEPPAEAPLHTAIYKKRPDVNAIVHTHSPMVVVLGAMNIGLRPIHITSAMAFSEGIPIYGGAGLINSSEIGDEVAERLGEHPAVMLRNHGDIVVDESIEQCCMGAIWMEKAAALQYHACALGEPSFMSKDEAEHTRKQTIAGKAYGRSWDHFVWRLAR